MKTSYEAKDLLEVAGSFRDRSKDEAARVDGERTDKGKNLATERSKVWTEAAEILEVTTLTDEFGGG